jgi:hypothetical protein
VKTKSFGAKAKGPKSKEKNKAMKRANLWRGK